MSEARAASVPGNPLAGEVLDEHRECMRKVLALEEILDHTPDGEGAWLGSLNERLGDLEATLSAHFEDEAEGHLFGEMPTKYPRFATRLEALEKEHADILVQIAALRTRARTLRKPELYELRELNARAQLLVATIRRHEAEENEIILSAYWEEFGGGD